MAAPFAVHRQYQTTYNTSRGTSPMEYTTAPDDSPEYGEPGYDYGYDETRPRDEVERGGPLDIDSDGGNDRTDLDGSGDDAWDVDRDNVDDTSAFDNSWGDDDTYGSDD